jgi:hypothetical protein
MAFRAKDDELLTQDLHLVQIPSTPDGGMCQVLKSPG